MTSKPFISIDEQIELLEKRGLKTDERTANILLSESYYSIVNGYNNFFLDKDLTSKNGEDTYIKDATFSELYELYRFDRGLREVTFRYLLQAEAIIKTVVVYMFCKEHQYKDSYLDFENYVKKDDYINGSSHYTSNIIKLISTLQRRAYADRKCKDYIKHYRMKHKEVPLWVLANVLTFGNISAFYTLQNRKIQSGVCKEIIRLRGDDPSKQEYLSPEAMHKTISILVEFRNICAHDERLFCAKAGTAKNKQYSYVSMIDALESILPAEQIAIFLEEVAKLTTDAIKENTRVRQVIEQMGFSVFYGEKN